jgi:CDGSH-type Zn-finger protein
LCRRRATIKVLQNRPYLGQRDGVTAIDWNGATYAIPKRQFVLCRCCVSTNKPFCDGDPTLEPGSAEAAVPRSEDTNQSSSDGLLSGLPDLPAAKLIAVIAPCTKRAMMQHVTAGAADENIENDCRTDRPHPRPGLAAAPALSLHRRSPSGALLSFTGYSRD